MKLLERIKLFIYDNSMGFSILPFQMTINVANPCNRACSFCPNHSKEIVREYPWGWYQEWWRKQNPYMDVDKFADFIKRMGFWRRFIKQLSFTGRGETLLHKDILKFCDVAERYKIQFHITTNGDFLTANKEEALSKYKYLHYVRISLFDVDRADHWFYRQKYSPIPIVIQNVTGHHIEGLDDGYISTNNVATAKYSTMPTGFVDEAFCRAPFSFNTLNTDGSLVTCIAFREVGNVFTDSWWSCWNGLAMRRHRMEGLHFKIPPHLAFCKDCGYFMQNSKNNYWKVNKLK